MAADSTSITGTDLKISQGEQTHDLHLTRGLRGHLVANPLQFDILPVHGAGPNVGVGPFSIEDAHLFSAELGLRVLGLDSVERTKSPLAARTWRPIVRGKRMNAADLWSTIQGNLDENRHRERDLARYISFSILAAGIRIRDASDQYRLQLMDAIARGAEPGQRFTNVPLFDIRLSLHSVLSELSSARDYIAAWFGAQLGAPTRIDALNRLVKWIPAGLDRNGYPDGLEELLRSYEARENCDTWAKELTDLRNLHLHREPLGSGQFMHFELKTFGAFAFPTLRYPTPYGGEDGTGQDYLEVISDLFAKLEAFAARVALGSGISCELPSIVVN